MSSLITNCEKDSCDSLLISYYPSLNSVTLGKMPIAQCQNNQTNSQGMEKILMDAVVAFLFFHFLRNSTENNSRSNSKRTNHHPRGHSQDNNSCKITIVIIINCSFRRMTRNDTNTGGWLICWFFNTLLWRVPSSSTSSDTSKPENDWIVVVIIHLHLPFV